jgi:hypothetical protein
LAARRTFDFTACKARFEPDAEVAPHDRRPQCWNCARVARKLDAN